MADQERQPDPLSEHPTSEEREEARLFWRGFLKEYGAGYPAREHYINFSDLWYAVRHGRACKVGQPQFEAWKLYVLKQLMKR